MNTPSLALSPAYSSAFAPAFAPARWATASHADAGSGHSVEQDDLRAHLAGCLGSRGRWFGMECLGEAVHGFVAPRLMTTLAIAAVAIASAVLAANALFG